MDKLRDEKKGEKGRTAVIRETEKGGMAEEIGEVSGRPGKNREEEKRSS